MVSLLHTLPFDVRIVIVIKYRITLTLGMINQVVMMVLMMIFLLGQISFCATGPSPELFSQNFGVKDFTADNWRFDAMFSREKQSGMVVATLNQPLSRGEVRLKGKDVEIDHKYLQEELDLRMYVAICSVA